MKENKYDDQSFFEKYSGMNRSMLGLAGAGEWRELEKLLPDFKGRRVLDLGCGFGWHCIYAAEHGASAVLGTDISRKMLEKATAKNTFPCVRYECAAMEDLDFPAAAFDVIISSLALHYISDISAMMKKIADWLAPGGELVFSMEHPVFTACGSQDWFYDHDGRILHFPVDRYFESGRREANFLGEKVVKYHHTLTECLGAVLDNGFSIKKVVEPQPSPEMMAIPGMADELRRPMMLLVAAVKN